IGRFITPDTVTDISGLGKRDGLNRYVFENNDPVNHVDPTGHWSWDAIGGIILGAVLIGAAIAVTVATAGVASPLGAALAAG
ncbi:UNVERIFIED_CONTAM: RHS repeat-associated core domain-containing protein, partial [Bacteroidetes bacterium 56_B9]